MNSSVPPADDTVSLATLLQRERVISQLAAQLLTADSESVEQVIADSLVKLGEHLDADRAFVMVLNEDGDRIELVTEWVAKGLLPAPLDVYNLDRAVADWWAAALANDEVLVLRTLDDMREIDGVSPDAARAVLQAQHVTGALMLSLRAGDRPQGTLGLTVVDRPYPFADQSASQLLLACRVFVHRLQRARSEFRLRELRQELEHRNTELERSNRELEEFAYVASHDLKSPVLVVRGFLDLLARGKGGPLTPEAITFVEAALRGTRRLEQLIEDLLAYSRAGRRSTNEEEVSLTTILEQSRTDLGPILAEAGAELELGYLPEVHGDPGLLTQLFSNLIANAVKFARDGVPPRVSVSATNSAGGVVVRVADNGVGIAESDRERVFGMFTRLDATADRTGSGIGLAVCQRITEAHSGRLWIEPRPDGEPGTVFNLYLPT